MKRAKLNDGTTITPNWNKFTTNLQEGGKQHIPSIEAFIRQELKKSGREAIGFSIEEAPQI